MDLSEKINELIIQGKRSTEIKSILSISGHDLKSICSEEQWKLIIDNNRKFTNQNLHRNRKVIDIFTFPVDDILIEIKNGFGCSEISEKFNVEKNIIFKIANNFNENIRLKQNNYKYISKRTHECALEKQKDRLLSDFKDFHVKIANLIESGSHLSLICSEIDLPTHRIKKVINLLGLNEKLNENTKRIVTEKNRKNSLLGAEKTRGITFQRHEITEEMKSLYKEFLVRDIFEGAAKIEFKNQFRTIGKTWDLLTEEFGQIKKHPRYFLSGSNNKMFGREPDWKAGNGIKGKIFIKNKLIYFRSSLELRIYCYLDYNNIDFELSKHIVKYFYKGILRNYFQDIVIGDCIYEIKPVIKLEWEINQIKFKSLQEYCKKFNLKCDYLTEFSFDLTLIDIKFINNKIEQGLIILNDKEYARLLKYAKKW